MSSIFCTPKISNTYGHKIRLLPFLRRLLDSGTHGHIIRWIDRFTQEFQFVDPEAIAELWGAQKNRQTKMTFDTLTRALRDFCRKDKTLEKVRGKVYNYRFLNPSPVMSYAPRTPLPFTIENILYTSGHRYTSSGYSSLNTSPTSSSSSNSSTKTSPTANVSTATVSPLGGTSSSSNSSGSTSPLTFPFLLSPLQIAQLNQNMAGFQTLISLYPGLKTKSIPEQVDIYFKAQQGI